MRKSLLTIVALVVAAIPMAAAPVCGEADAGGVDVATISQCTVGPFVFSNFLVGSGLNMDGAAVGLGATSYDALTETYFLRFGTNFNLINPTLFRDVIFSYEITGPLYAIDGSLGGTGSLVLDAGTTVA